MSLLKDHFNEILLAVLSLVFALLATWILAKEGWNAQDGFKWAGGVVTTLVGALLALLIKQGNQPGPPANGANLPPAVVQSKP